MTGSGGRMRKRPGGSKPLDVALLREVLRDRRTWTAHGLVVKPDGGEHFEIDGEDVLIEVQLADSGIPITCRLGTICAGPGVGIYSVPDVGAEVAVLIPKGEIDGEPVVIATLSTGKVPDGVDGSGTIVIAVKQGAKVLVHDGNANDAKALVTKADFDGHKHPLPIIVAPNGNCTIGAPTPSPGDTGGAPAATGTVVLKAK